MLYVFRAMLSQLYQTTKIAFGTYIYDLQKIVTF